MRIAFHFFLAFLYRLYVKMPPMAERGSAEWALPLAGTILGRAIQNEKAELFRSSAFFRAPGRAHPLARLGFAPNGWSHTQQILLRANAGEDRIFASGKTTPSGNLHIAGAWNSDAHPTEIVPAVVSSIGSWGDIYCFYFENDGWFVAKVASAYRGECIGIITWR